MYGRLYISLVLCHDKDEDCSYAKLRYALGACMLHPPPPSIGRYTITMHVLFQYLQNRIFHSGLLIRLVSQNYSSLYFKLVRLTSRPSFCMWFDSTRIPKRSARTHVINKATMIPGRLNYWRTSMNGTDHGGSWFQCRILVMTAAEVTPIRKWISVSLFGGFCRVQSCLKI